MNGERKTYLKLMLTLFGAAALAILFYFLLAQMDRIAAALGKVVGILMPFLVGGVIAYILSPICNGIEGSLSKALEKGNHSAKPAKSLSVLLTLLLSLLVIAAALLLVIPALVESIQAILLQIPGSLEAFQTWATELIGSNETLQNYVDSLTELASTDLQSWVSDAVLPNLQTLIGGIPAGITGFVSVFYNLMMGIIVSIYLLGSRKLFARQGKKLVYAALPKRWADSFLDELAFANRMFSGFISGRLVDSLIIGLICFVGMLLLRIPDALLVSVIVGITNILPVFGPWIGAIPSFLLILMADPVKSVVFLVFVLVLQQFDGNILSPRILGDRTGLSGFWVLFAILLFGGLFGFAGMLVGVPVFAVIYDIVCKLVNRGLAFRRSRG